MIDNSETKLETRNLENTQEILKYVMNELFSFMKQQRIKEMKDE